MRAQHLTASVLAVALVSCTGRLARSPATAADSIEGYAERAERQQVAWLKHAANALPTVAAPRAESSDRFAIGAGDATSHMIIRTGQASIEVDSLEPAVAMVRAVAQRVGGYVANTTMQTGRGQLRSASLEVKIPADRFEEALAGLAPIGKLESVNVSAEDVGEEYVDVTARMANARRLESRLIDLLAARTGKLKDVLDVEQELARVREEIERHEGRLRYLKAHAALSTLTISVHEPVPVVGHAGSSVMGEAFKQAWRNFVDLAAACVRALGFVIPLAFVATLAWLGISRWRKARTPRAAEA